MEWFGIAALLLLLCYSAYPGKVKRLETKVKRLEKKQRGVAYMSKLINDLVGKQCIIRSEFIFSFAGKTELSCKIIDADDEWIKICYTEKKDKRVVKLVRIEFRDRRDRIKAIRLHSSVYRVAFLDGAGAKGRKFVRSK